MESEFDAFNGVSQNAEYNESGLNRFQQRQQQQGLSNGQTFFQQPTLSTHMNNTVSHCNIKVPYPKRYDCSRDIITLGNWMFSVDRYLILTKIPIGEQVLYVSTLLDGEALLWFRSHYENLDYSTLIWKDIRDALKEFFAPPNSNRRLRDAWANIKQTGSVFDYVSKLEAIAMQLPDLTNAQKLDKFIRDLKPKTRIEVELRDPTTTNEAYRLADRFDRIVYGKYERDSFLPIFTKPNKWEDRRGEPMQLDSLHFNKSSTSRMMANAITSQYIHRPLSDKERSTLRASGACFNCRKFGHIARDCPEPKSISQSKTHWKLSKRSPKSGNGPRRQ